MWDLKQFGENIALKDENGTELTYSEMDNICSIIRQKAGKRCLVISFCTNTIGAIAGYTAFLNGNIVPMLLNAHLDKDLRDNLLSLYKPAYLWAPDFMKEDFGGCETVYSVYGYSLLQMPGAPDTELYDELGLLLTTSGSTGSPKFVRQSYKNISSNAASIAEYLALDESERPVTMLPMNYTYGLSIINSHLLVGATILVTEYTLMQKEFWKFVKQEKATSFSGVPYTYEMLDKLKFFRMELPCLKSMTQAGGKLQPELHKKFAEYALRENKKFVVMYGQCEATARMAYLPPEKSLEKYGSIGIAIPGGKLSLADTAGNPIREADTVGELIYEGENVTLGYAECREDLRKADEQHGILQTGDMARADSEGYFYIVGRKKRFLKVYGNRVNLDEIDTMLKSKYPGLECASGGRDDLVYIFVTDETYSQEIPGYISEKTKLNPKAFRIKVIEEIPKNDAGKTLYKELEQYYE